MIKFIEVWVLTLPDYWDENIKDDIEDDEYDKMREEFADSVKQDFEAVADKYDYTVTWVGKKRDWGNGTEELAIIEKQDGTPFTKKDEKKWNDFLDEWERF